MSPEAFKATLAALDFNQRTAAEFFGVNERQIRRWTIGEAPVPDAVRLLLGLMLAKKLTPSKVLALVGPHEQP